MTLKELTAKIVALHNKPGDPDTDIHVSAHDYAQLLNEASSHLHFTYSKESHFHNLVYLGHKIVPSFDEPTTPKSAMLEAIALARKNHPDLFGEKA